MPWPEKASEIRQLVGKHKVGNEEIELTEEKLCGMLWRGFTLSFQGGSEILSEEEKAARKARRKRENEAIKILRDEAKAKGMDLAAYLASLRG